MVKKETNKSNGEIVNADKTGIYVSCCDGELIVKEIQFAGKKKMQVSDYINGIDKNSLIGKKFEQVII